MHRFILALCSAWWFISGCGVETKIESHSYSLTDPSYTGHKYYFGFGAVKSWDPAMMHNEVKYDVRHTHDIFTQKIGGDYQGHTLIGTGVNSQQIHGHWDELSSKLEQDDMYVQYSSSHGHQSGLAVGVSYDEIRDEVLAMPAQEKIIFTMACHSGGLVKSFNRKRSEWQDYQDQGKNLLVFASSEAWQTSSTGPGTDPDEPDGVNGSAGSAFGHALWKALIGAADGYTTGVADGYLNLEEIIEFTTAKTRKVGGHTPVHTGSFDKYLIMNEVPSKEEIAKLISTRYP